MLQIGLVALALASVAAGGFALRCQKTGRSEKLGGLAKTSVHGAQAGPIAWQAPSDVARGAAHAGPWRMNESSFLYVDDGTLAVSDAGVVGVAWVDNARKDVLFRKYTKHGRPTGETVNVSRSPSVFSWLPRVVMDDARVFALWQEIVFSGGSHGGDIFFARSDDAGQSFGAPQNLSNSTDGDGKGQLTKAHWHNGSLDLLRLSDGTLVAAWTSYEGSLFVSRSEDAGASWASPTTPITHDRLPARAPALAASGTNTVYLAWAVGRDPSGDIWLARSADRGRSFGPPSSVGDDGVGGYADAPKLVVDARSTLHLAYTTSLAGFFGPYQVCYARSTAAGSFEAPRIIAGAPGTEQGASYPSLALDRRGNVYLAWEHHPDRHEAARGLGFAYSGDGGHSFTPPSVVPGTAAFELGVNGSRQGKLAQKLGVNAAGLVALVDSRLQEGERSVVQLIVGWQK